MSTLQAGVRRVLLALSGASEELAAIDAAAELAAALEAELAALFVEDVDLIRACRLPSMWEIGRLSGERRALAWERTARLLQATARRYEQALIQAAQARSLRYTFHVLQGKPLPLLLQQAANPDVVLLVRRTVHVRGRPRPVVTLFDGSMAAAAAITVALRVARATDRPCVVLIAAPDPESFRAQAQQVGWAIGSAHDVSLERLPEARPDAVAAAANRLRAAALVLPADSVADLNALERLRARLNSDLLLVP